ncbi:MAG: hypothetical protein ACE5F9_09580 [Phycisphaerae bacterium]
MAEIPTSSSTDCVPPFEEHVKTVLGRIRSTLAELLACVGADPTRPQEVARQLNVNKNLTWKVSRVIRAADPAAAVPHIPGKAGMTILLDSFKRAGASIEAIKAVRLAMAEFEEMRAIHAGDRESLDMMLGNLARNSNTQQQNEALRKLAFRGNSAIWGVQARVQLCVNVIAPNPETQDWVDLTWLSGLVDYRRLRRDVVWAMASSRKVQDDGTPLELGRIEAVDPEFEGDGKVPLVGELCSRPLPELRTVTGSDGMIRYELLEGPVGNTAAASCVIGIFGRAFVRRTRATNDTIGEHAARIYTPVECLIHDFFVHKDLRYALSPEAFLYSQLPGGPVFPASGRDQGMLPMHERLQRLGGCPPDFVTPELPQYSQQLEAVFRRLKWDPDDFHGFRFKMQYPPIPAIAVLRYDLPDRA